MTSDDSMGVTENLLKRLNDSNMIGSPIAFHLAGLYLDNFELPLTARIIVADWLIKQDGPQAISLLLDVLCDEKQPSIIRDICRDKIFEKKDQQELLYQVDAQYQKLQRQMIAINEGAIGSLKIVGENLNMLQRMERTINSKKNDSAISFGNTAPIGKNIVPPTKG